MEKEFNRVVNQYKRNSNLWTDVVQAYTSKGRHYHTLVHLNHLITELKPFQNQFTCWETLVFAIAYHDFVYKATVRDNEEQSAKVAEARLTEINFLVLEIARCKQFILVTKKHEPVNREIDLFTDADLAILGATPERYQQYTVEIRKEYSIYPDLLYKAGRKKVLQHFLKMNRIYKTIEFYERYEQTARRNLQTELEKVA
jgi:predicted metal-dependent HD superfamily phosphohydrolase